MILTSVISLEAAIGGPKPPPHDWYFGKLLLKGLGFPKLTDRMARHERVEDISRM